jgi:hypothetical protein
MASRQFCRHAVLTFGRASAVLSTSATVSAMDERELRVRLGYWLQGQGACNTEQFLNAFQEVPRQELVREGWFIGWDGFRIHSRD